MKKCVNCGEISSNDCDFCPRCGLDNLEYVEEVTCPHCGAINAEAFAFCVECGGQLVEGARDRLIPSAVPAIADTNNADDDALGHVGYATSEETIECPNCHTLVSFSSSHCTHCGADLSSLLDQCVVHRKICSVCNTPNVMEAQYCSRCFASLLDASVDEFVLVHETAYSGDVQYSQAVLENGNVKFLVCNNCGAVNAYGEDFCDKCGVKLRVERQYSYCPQCGAENEGESMYCVNCKASLYKKSESLDSDGWTCPNCGSLNSANNNFCARCGAPCEVEEE